MVEEVKRLVSPNPLFVPTPLSAQPVSWRVRGRRGTTARWVSKQMRSSSLLAAIVFVLPVLAHAESGSEAVRRHFDISPNAKLTESIVKNAVLRLVPIGTELNQVVVKLSNLGLGHPAWPSNPKANMACFPDRTPIVCQFRTPKDLENQNEPNWTVEFFFNQKNELETVEARRWHYRGRK